MVARIPPRARRLARRWTRLAGPFAMQDNNEIRAFEYPWAFYASELRPGMRAMELGGGMSGFQFVLDKTGLDVTNVDPGDPDRAGWGATPEKMARANRWFGTSVALVDRRLQDADFAPATFDRVFSISTLEHVPRPECYDLIGRMAALLKPGGTCVMTVDLFLDLLPFTSRPENAYGSNLDIRALIEASGMELVAGERHELYGFDEFDADAIQSNLRELFYGWGYPALAQVFVLRKGH